MKKISLLLITILFVILNVNGQETIDVGSNTIEKQEAPLNPYDKQGITQTIYLKDEIGKGGSIEELTFYINSTMDKSEIEQNSVVDIYLINTDQSEFLQYSNYFPISTMDKVATRVSGIVDDTKSKITYKITSFSYDNKKNLGMCMVWKNDNFASAELYFGGSKKELRTIYTSSNYADVTDETLRDSGNGNLNFLPKTTFKFGTANTNTGNTGNTNTGNSTPTTATPVEVEVNSGEEVLIAIQTTGTSTNSKYHYKEKEVTGSGSLATLKGDKLSLGNEGTDVIIGKTYVIEVSNGGTCTANCEVKLIEAKPIFTSVVPVNAQVCASASGEKVEFTITGTPGAEVTYTGDPNKNTAIIGTDGTVKVEFTGVESSTTEVTKTITITKVAKGTKEADLTGKTLSANVIVSAKPTIKIVKK